MTGRDRRPRPWRRWAGAGVICLALSWSAWSAAPASDAAVPAFPELASGYTAKAGASASRFMVAAAHPLAAEAGYRVLREGGTAVDAAVAVQMVLTLVEPQSSGIGGGAFLMLWDGERVHALDGRETAPAQADEGLFLQPDGTPMPFRQAVAGGRSVGVPGTVKLLETAHRRHGRLPWPRLLQPAIDLAIDGFDLSPRMHAQLKADSALKGTENARRFFYQPDGQPWPVGHRLRNPALAHILRALAARGSEAFYAGDVAADLVARVRNDPRQPGRLTLADLRAYEVREREPLCTPWRTWRLCGFPPPSSGHLTLMQILALGDLNRWGGEAQWVAGEWAPTFLHHYTEAARLAFADRDRYVADPDFVPPPGRGWDSLLDPRYLRERARLVGPTSMQQAQPGLPPGGLPLAWGMPAPQPEMGTSHLSIVDGEGRAVAMTTTIEAVWGAGILADGGSGLPGGYLLNNELTDFSLAPADAQGRPIANRVQGGKRPRSSMSPTLVFEQGSGRFVLSVGSPGGAAIIHFTAKALLGMLGFGLDPQRAVDLPNFGSFNGPTVLEKGRFSPSIIQALKDQGHVVIETDLTSGLQAIQRTANGWQGGADPRREGVVKGD